MIDQKHRRLVEEAGGLHHGHFVFTGGLHSDCYIDKIAALARADHALVHATRVAEHFLEHDIEAVVGPELGAVMWMADLRSSLSRVTGRGDIVGIIATKGTDGFVIGRGQENRLRGRRALVADDIWTKGYSAAQVVAAVRRAGGVPVAATALWNRGGVTAEILGVPVSFALINDYLPAYSPDSNADDYCPLCKANIEPRTDFGHGAEFLRKRELVP